MAVRGQKKEVTHNNKVNHHHGIWAPFDLKNAVRVYGKRRHGKGKALRVTSKIIAMQLRYSPKWIFQIRVHPQRGAGVVKVKNLQDHIQAWSGSRMQLSDKLTNASVPENIFSGSTALYAELQRSSASREPRTNGHYALMLRYGARNGKERKEDEVAVVRLWGRLWSRLFPAICSAPAAPPAWLLQISPFKCTWPMALRHETDQQNFLYNQCLL